MTLPEVVVIQTWSKNGLTDEMRRQYDAILSTEDERVKAELLMRRAPIEITVEGVRETPEKISAEIEPWKDHMETIKYLCALAAEIARFLVPGKSKYTNRVRNILSDAGILGKREKPGRPRKGRRKKRGLSAERMIAVRAARFKKTGA